jgi:hypothetical protein
MICYLIILDLIDPSLQAPTIAESESNEVAKLSVLGIHDGVCLLAAIIAEPEKEG